ncbi:MAG: PIN domain-containing protein [Candidatus Omnitrophota bacterium]
MRLVIDANILLAALLKNAATRELLFEETIELFAPEQLSTEVNRLLKNPKIRRRIPLNNKKLSELSAVIFARIIFVPEQTFLFFIKRSLSLVTHIEDAPYIGLCLALKIPLWSNDTDLKLQSKVKVYTTQELINLLS